MSQLCECVQYAYRSKDLPGLTCTDSVQFEKIPNISHHGSLPPKYKELGHFTLLFCRGQQRNAPRFKTHVPAIVLLIKTFVWCRSRHRRRRGLLKLPVIYRAAVFASLSGSSDGTAQAQARIITSFTAALLNLLAINVMKLFYKKLAVWLTDWENPPTRSGYKDSFAWKIYLFQFVNTYSSVFYKAFFKSGHMIGTPQQIKTDRWNLQAGRMQRAGVLSGALSCICVYKLRRPRRFVRLISLLGLVRCFAEFPKGLLVKDW